MVRILVILAFASASTLFGQADPEAPSTRIFPPPSPGFEELKQNLGLTTFQVEQLLGILKEKAEAMQEIYKQIAQKESELYSLLNSGSQDANRIGKLMIDIQALRVQPPSSNTQYRQRALAVLSADQKAKLVSLEQALRLNAPAYQAITLNLIDGQPVQIMPMPYVPRFMGSAEVSRVPPVR